MWVRRRHRPRPSDATEAVSDHVPTGVTPGAAKAPSRRYISWTVLAMMTVGSVGYLGSTPATSVFGLASVSLVAAELPCGWEGGVYNWVREGVSAPMGLLAVWCEFAQTIFYYPALLAD